MEMVSRDSERVRDGQEGGEGRDSWDGWWAVVAKSTPHSSSSFSRCTPKIHPNFTTSTPRGKSYN